MNKTLEQLRREGYYVATLYDEVAGWNESGIDLIRTMDSEYGRKVIEGGDFWLHLPARKIVCPAREAEQEV